MDIRLSSDTVTNTDELLTAEQAAQLVRRTTRTISRWAESGRLVEAMKLPGETGARLFRRSDVEALAGELAS